MATLLLESWDIYSGRTGGLPDASNGRWNSTGSTSSSVSAGRFGGRQMEYANTVTTMTDYLDLASSAQTIRGGFSFQILSLQDAGVLTSGQPIFDVRDSSNVVHCDFTLDASGMWRCRRAATTSIATSDRSIRRIRGGRYHHIEFEIKIDDTTGTVKMWIDGILVMNGSGLDTANSATLSVGRFAWRATTALDTTRYIDDLWITDGASYGEARSVQLLPDAYDSGNLVASTSTNVSCVDEAIVNTSDYVQGTTAGDKDTYSLANLPSTLDTVCTAMVIAYANNITPAGTSRAFLVSGATTDNTPAITNTTTFSRIQEIHDVDPNTAAAWTVSNINACKVGVEVAT